MELTRREFLRMAGASAVGTVLFAGCAVPTKELLVQSPRDMPEDMVTGFDDWYASIYPTSAGTEGIIVRVIEGRAKKVEGNPDYPVNQGKSSARAQAALQALYHPDRIQRPLRRQGDTYVETSWDTALDELVSQLEGKRSSPDKVLLITQPLRGTLGKLVQQFAEKYGARYAAYEAIETTVLRQAVKDVFGQDRLPDFDIANADVLLSFGADFLGTWLAPVRYGMGYGEFRQGEARKARNQGRGYFVQVEPRMSQTAANADEWVFIKPGTEGILALSLAHALISDGLAKNAAAVDGLTGGQGRDWTPGFSVEEAAEKTGVSAERIHDLARRLAEADRSLVIGGGSAGAHTNGLYNLRAIYALNLLLDNVNKEGGVLFNPAFPLGDIPSSATGASYKEWKDLAKSIDGDTVVILRGVDPVYGLPPAAEMRNALQRAGFVISFSSFKDETTLLADMVLPEHAVLESWGDDVPDPAPAYATWGLQQPVVQPLFDTRGFGDVLLAAVQEMGMGGDFPWNNTFEMLRNTAMALYDSGQTGLINAADFDGFWRGVLMRGGWWDPGRKAGEGVTEYRPLPTGLVEPEPSGRDLPFHLLPFASIGLVDGQGAHLVWLQATPDALSTMVWKTWVEVNPRTAQEEGWRLGDEVELINASGDRINALVYPHPAASPDVVSVPMGQGHRDYGQWAQGRGDNVFHVLSDVEEKDTQALAWAGTRVRVRPTGRRFLMTAVEGNVPSVEPEDVDIVQVTRG